MEFPFSYDNFFSKHSPIVGNQDLNLVSLPQDNSTRAKRKEDENDFIYLPNSKKNCLASLFVTSPYTIDTLLHLINSLENAVDCIVGEWEIDDNKKDEELVADFCKKNLDEINDHEVIKELISLYAWASILQEGCPAAEYSQEGLLEFLGCKFLFDLITGKPNFETKGLADFDSIHDLSIKVAEKQGLDIIYEAAQGAFCVDDSNRKSDCADLLFDFFDGTVSQEECFNLMAYMYEDDDSYLATHPLYLDVYLTIITSQRLYGTLPKEIPPLDSIKSERAKILIEKIESYVRTKPEVEPKQKDFGHNFLSEYNSPKIYESSLHYNTNVYRGFSLRPDNTFMNGIENGGNTCYMDTVISSLLATLPGLKDNLFLIANEHTKIQSLFYNIVKQVVGEETKSISKNEMNEFRLVLQKQFPKKFTEMWNALADLHQVYEQDPKEFEELLVDLIEDPYTQAKAQEDAAVFLECLLNKECLGPVLFPNPTHCFKQWRRFARPEKLEGEDKYDYSETFNTVFDLDHYSPIVPIKIEEGNGETAPLGDLLTGMKKSIKTVHIYEKGDQKKYLPIDLMCLEQPVIFSKEEAPPYFIVQLGRFGFNNQAFKRQNPVPVSEIVSIPLCEKRTSKVLDESVNYQLCAVVVHHGFSPNGGHYVTYEKKGNSWNLYDSLEGVSQCAEQIVPHAVLTNGYLYYYKKI